MKWEDQGIVISAQKQGENAALLRMFTREHGVHAGILRGATSKAKRALIMPGNMLQLSWSARLPEHLGSFAAEMEHPVAAMIWQDADKLQHVTMICEIVRLLLPERDPHPKLYDQLQQYLAKLVNTPFGDVSLMCNYVRLEAQLLQEMGFGLDLSQCAATGVTDDLCYVSPRSGCAVSQAAGRPYHDKMLPLPAFLTGDKVGGMELAEQDIADGLKLTGFFLDKYFTEHLGKDLPELRTRMETDYPVKREYGEVSLRHEA